jgi:ADP-heptose:LPS heptosyltransferase
MKKKFLLRHLGNMGDLVFFVPPLLETLKKVYPDCHITFVTVWGFKEKKRKWLAPGWLRHAKPRSRGEVWGRRNQGGFSISLMMTNPHIDQLVHWHDTVLSLDNKICSEEGKSFPTWNQAYYEKQTASGKYTDVLELDIGLHHEENPIERMYKIVGLPQETYSNYRLYFTPKDLRRAQEVMQAAPRPRIVLLESLVSRTTRGWDPEKIPALERAIEKAYKVKPLWFGGEYVPEYQGRPLTLRENIATLLHADVAIGALSGPLHFAAAIGTPTITLYCDHQLHRAAPAYFLNRYIADPHKYHRTLLGPSPEISEFLKPEHPTANLTPQEVTRQNFKSWVHPGRQATKSCLAVITVDEIMTVLQEMLPV